jgi:hypothetical protein
VRSRIVVVMAVVGAVIVGGCGQEGGDTTRRGGSGDDVVSLRTGGAASPMLVTQMDRAEAHYACLTDAGLPATLTPVSDDEAEVGWSMDEHVVLGSAPGLGPWWGAPPGKDLPESEVNEFVESVFYKDEVREDYNFALMIDGVDRTADLERCTEESDYTRPEYALDPSEMAAMTRAQADATNEWVACARENGYPALKDVTPTDEGVEPVRLPFSTTEEAFRTLLAACPNWDRELAEAQANGTELPSEWESAPTPDINFEEPERSEDPDEDAVVQAHWDRLHEILWEEASAFWTEWAGQSGD